MARLTTRRVQLLLAALFLGSSAIRVAVGLTRVTPVFYPDEYIYSTLARAIAANGVPSLRGGPLHFPSLLAPYLMAPEWLITDVGRAYHAVIAVGSISFSAAVFPAYVLARRVGVSPGGGLLVALLAILVPDAAFATTALTEPYAYPLFLVTVIVLIDAVVSPTRSHQVSALLLTALLCLLRAQFVVLPVAYLVSTLVQERGSWRRTLRAHPAVLGSTLVGVIGAAAAAQFYTGLGSHWSAVLSISPWLGLDLFVLAAAAGWAIVPGAVLGLPELIRSRDAWQRTFGVFATSASLLIVLEAAYFDTIQHRVHERYTFYAVPLLAIACVVGLKSESRRARYAIIAYALAVLAILVPATSSFRGADSGQAPTLLALHSLGSGAAQLAWAIPLSLVAVAVAQLRGARRAPLVIASVVAGVLCVAGTHALLGFVPIAQAAGSHRTDLFKLGAPPHSALVTWSGTDRFELEKTLFWTRGIDRVLVLGGGPAADGFGSEPVTFGRHGIVHPSGRPVRGPFAFGPATTAFVSSSAASRWLLRSPPVLVLGLNRENGDLSTAAMLFAAAAKRPRAILLELTSSAGVKQLTFDCVTRKFRVNIGRAPVPVRFAVPAGAVGRCRISLTRGAAAEHDGAIVSGVRVTRLATVEGTAAG